MRWINFFSLYFPVYFRHINRSLLLPFLDWKKTQILVIYQWHHSEIAIEAPSKKFLLRVLQLGSGSGVDRVLRGDCCQQLTFPMLSWQIQSGKFTSSTSPKDCGWNSSLAHGISWLHPPQNDTNPKNFPVPIPTSLCLASGQNTSRLEERKQSKVCRAAQLAPLPLFVYCDLSGLMCV